MPQDRRLKAHRDGVAAGGHREAAEGYVGVVEGLWLPVDEGAPAGIVGFRGDQVRRPRGFYLELQ